MFFGLNDVAFLAAASAAAGPGFDFLDPANIGQPVEGGFFAGLISHTADGNPTHALIVAPRETGASGGGYTLTTNLQWKTGATATAGTSSDFDGAANTAAMVAAGIADHPAAEFCVNLSIGGFADWYLPARWELDVAYFHLKPTTAGNNTNWGDNPYSVPRRDSKYTAGNPTQTTVTAFQSTQSEAFVADIHWPSTEAGTGNAWRLDLSNGFQNASFSKTANLRVRAFRKIAL
jgi:hypothetical protein